MLKAGPHSEARRPLVPSTSTKVLLRTSFSQSYSSQLESMTLREKHTVPSSLPRAMEHPKDRFSCTRLKQLEDEATLR